MLDAETIDRLLELGSFAEQTGHPPQEPEHVYLVRRAGGEFQREEALVRPRAYVAADLEPFVELVVLEHDRLSDASTVIFVGSDEVLAILRETSDRRDAVKCPLARSMRFRSVEALDGGRSWLTQRGFLTLLKNELDMAAHDLTAQVRNLRFTKRDDGTMEIKAGRESLGRSVLTEVAGELGALPEAVTISVPVFQTITDGQEDTYHAEVRLLIDIDVAEAKFQIRPAPDQVAEALGRGLSWVRQKLKAMLLARGSDIPVCLASGNGG